jgi:hypothetical protein
MPAIVAKQAARYGGDHIIRIRLWSIAAAVCLLSFVFRLCATELTVGPQGVASVHRGRPAPH